MAAADTIRILIATDSHIGYLERDAIRGDDSWKSFDEVMRIAKARDVDMVLLSGDLFHENKPSRKAIYQCMKTLRQTCLGDKPCELEVLSDTAEEFAMAGGHINYEDPDINVAIPVFSIHGNHDDPGGVCCSLWLAGARADGWPADSCRRAGSVRSTFSRSRAWSTTTGARPRTTTSSSAPCCCRRDRPSWRCTGSRTCATSASTAPSATTRSSSCGRTLTRTSGSTSSASTRTSMHAACSVNGSLLNGL